MFMLNAIQFILSADKMFRRNKRKRCDLQPFSDEHQEAKGKSKFSVYKGLLLAMLSGFFYSLGAVIVKQMKNLSPGQLALYRFIGIFVFSLPGAVKSRDNLLGPRKMRFLLVLRGVVGATNLLLNFIAFRYLPLGEAAVIIFSAPVFVTIAAKIFLKEPCGIFQAGTVFTTIIGIALTAKLPLTLSGSPMVYSKETLFGLLAAVSGVFFSTCRFIMIRKVKSVPSLIIMFNFGWVAILETAIITATIGDFGSHECGIQGLYIIVLGVLSYAGQILLTVALQCELAGPVSTIRAATDIALAFVWQTVIFHDIPDIYSSIGATLVGLSVIFVALNKWVSSLSTDSPYRKKFVWMTK